MTINSLGRQSWKNSDSGPGFAHHPEARTLYLPLGVRRRTLAVVVKFRVSTSGPSVDAEWQTYLKYLQEIRGRLPQDLAEFARLSLHDARIIEILHPEKRCVSVRLSGFVYEEFKSLTITVDEVVSEFAPDKLVGGKLWGHEVTLSDWALFEIRAKLETSELFICGNAFNLATEPFCAPNAAPRRRQ